MANSPFGAMMDNDDAALKSASNIADLATQSVAQPSFGSPEHADQPPNFSVKHLIASDDDQTATAMQQANYVAQKADPDRHAKVMALADELSMPVGMVDRQYDSLVKLREQKQTDYKQIVQGNPKLAQWLTDQDNAAIAKNTMPALQGVEDSVNTHTFTNQLLNTMGMAMAKMGSNIANLPALAFDTLTQSYNLTAKRNADMQKNFGVNPQDLADLDNQQMQAGGDFPQGPQNMGQTEQIKTPDILTHNAITDAARYAKQSYEKNLPALHYSVVAEAKDGNYLKAAQALTLQVASSAPDLAAAIGAGMIHPALGAAVFGAGSAASTSDEYREQGFDPAMGTTAAITHGIIAAGAGEIKILDALKPYESAIANAAGKPVAREVMKNVFQTIGATVGVQGTTGAGMSLADDMADYVTGINPNALQGSFGRAGDAFAVGAATGLGLGAVHNAPALLERVRQVNDTSNLKNFYKNITDQAKQIKFRDKLPDVQRDYIQSQTQDTPVENVYVDPEKLETYFQSKGQNPVAEMQKLGILPEYGAAKESGGDVKIKISDWVSKLGDSEHLTGLQNDVRFSPEGMSVNEQTEEQQRLKAEIDAQTQSAPKDGPTIEEQAQAFQDQYAQQLEDAGHDPKAAQLLGGLYKSIASRIGSDNARGFFEKLNLKINGPDAVADNSLETTRDLNQPAIFDPTADGSGMGAKSLADLLISKAGLSEGDGVRSAEAFRSMLSMVRGTALEHPEVLDSIIRSVPVDVVNHFFGSESAAKVALHNDAMLEHESAFNVKLPISESVDAANGVSGFLNEVARSAAKASGHVVDARGGSSEGLSALAADERNSFLGFSTFSQDGNSLEEPNARIRIGDQSINIDLLKTANRSSFLHEVGHLYLETLKRLSNHENAPEQLKTDYDTVRKWLGHEDGEITTDQHELFARGFERYLMEGKAPSESLRKAFAAFKVWLTHIYKSVTSLHSELSPEVRQVFDRMIATDEEIKNAQARQNRAPLFNETMTGLKVETLNKYHEAIQSAALEADDHLRAEAEADVLKSESAAYEKQKAEVREQVEKEANEQRVFKAQSLLQYDKLPDGSPRPEGVPELKISREDLRQRYGDEAVKEMPRMSTRDERGLDVDMVADLLGYQSADVMVSELRKALPRKEYIERQTEARMKDQNPQMTHGELVDSAMKFIHSERQAHVLELEMQMLRDLHPGALKGMIRQIVRRPPTAAEVRVLAEQNVGRQNVRDVTPAQYQAAERRFAKLKGEHLANNNIDAAFDAVRMELYNHELYRAAVNATEDVEKSLRQFRKMAITDEKASKNRDVNLAATAKAVLSAYGIGAPVDPATILDKIKRYDPEGYASAHVLVEMATAQGAKNYKEISYDQFQDMRDAVKGIWDLSRSQKQLEIAGKKVEKADVLEEMSSAIQEFGPSGKKPGYDQAITWRDKTKGFLLSAKNSLRRVESWATAMDGADKGIFRTHVTEPIFEATTQYRLAKEDLLKHYRDNVVEPAREIFSAKKIFAPEIGYTFQNKSELLGALLHTGNESNLSKLLRGREWGTVDETNGLDTSKWDSFINRMKREGTLTKADYDYVQGVWDTFEIGKPAAQKAHKAMYGYYFDEITNKPFENEFGKYKGGYAPAMADPMIVEDAQIRQDKNDMEQTNNSFMFPTAGRGFTKSRIESYAAPLALDLGLLPMAFDKVLRFTHIEPAVRDVSKLVMDREFRAQLASIDNTAASDMLIPWLQRAATQSVSTPSGTGKAWKGLDYGMRRLRGNTGFNAMAGNVVNTFHQFTGLSVVTAKVDAKYIAPAMWDYFKAPKQSKEAILEKSDFMRSKLGDVGGVQKEIEDVMLHPNKFQKVSDFIHANGYILQKMAQHTVEAVAWSGAYNKGLETGYSDAEAVKYADSIVRQTQHSSAPEDVSRFGTGSPMMRLFTQYFDYQNMKSNLLQTEIGNKYREYGIKKSMAANTALYLSALAIPAIMTQTVYKAFGGDFFKNGDDNSLMNNFMSIFFGGQIKELSSFVPIVGPAVNTAVSRFGSENHYDDRIGLSSPAIDNAFKAVTVPSEIYKAIHESGPKGPVIRDVMSLIGMMTGLPLQAAARPISYATDVAEGRVQPANGLDYARGLITGTGPKR